MIDSTIKSTVFEDNNGALLLATQQRITNRSKYYLVKWHFFWAHVNENPDISVSKISTQDQRAEYLTKPLSRDLFERGRRANHR